jgi:hypothetical protein
MDVTLCCLICKNTLRNGGVYLKCSHAYCELCLVRWITFESNINYMQNLPINALKYCNQTHCVECNCHFDKYFKFKTNTFDEIKDFKDMQVKNTNHNLLLTKEFTEMLKYYSSFLWKSGQFPNHVLFAMKLFTSIQKCKTIYECSLFTQARNNVFCTRILNTLKSIRDQLENSETSLYEDIFTNYGHSESFKNENIHCKQWIVHLSENIHNHDCISMYHLNTFQSLYSENKHKESNIYNWVQTEMISIKQWNKTDQMMEFIAKYIPDIIAACYASRAAMKYRELDDSGYIYFHNSDQVLNIRECPFYLHPLFSKLCNNKKACDILSINYFMALIYRFISLCLSAVVTFEKNHDELEEATGRFTPLIELYSETCRITSPISEEKFRPCNFISIANN